MRESQKCPKTQKSQKFPKGGARSELYYTAQIAVTCSQITVQTTSVF